MSGDRPKHEGYLTTADAAEYLGYKTTAGIRSAVLRGELVPDGAGPRNCHLFTRATLDAFVQARAERLRRPEHRAAISAPPAIPRPKQRTSRARRSSPGAAGSLRAMVAQWEAERVDEHQPKRGRK